MTRHLGYYVLDDDGRPLPLDDDDTLIWARWFEDHPRQVALDPVGDVRVSTIFLGLDHNVLRVLNPAALPVLWETMVFGGPLDGEMRRYPSREAALAGHVELLARVHGAAASLTVTDGDAAARVGTDARVGTKVGTKRETP